MTLPVTQQRILNLLESAGPRSRVQIEDALDLSDHNATRTLRAMINCVPKLVHRSAWEILCVNKRQYKAPIYAAGDKPDVPMPLSENTTKGRVRYNKNPPVYVHDPRADALLEATTGWHHNPSAPPWNAHPTQINYNPDRDDDYLHTIYTPKRCDAALAGVM